MSLPDRGPWVVAPTSSAVDWTVAAAALAATAAGRAAAVVLSGAADELLRERVATFVEARSSTVEDAVAVVRALTGTHIRILVIAGDGLVTPLGDGSWTAADLAAELPAPVAVITGTGTDAVGHTMLMLEALDTRRIPASVIAVGDGGDFTALPVRLAGQLPGDAREHPDRFAEWVHPLTGNPPPPATHPRPTPDLPTRIAKRAAIGLVVAFVVALFVLALFDGWR